MKANGLLQEALVLLARCHLLRLDWESALKTADLALSSHKKDVRALTVKGEALFNLCEFEHALVFFSRALVSFLKSFRIYTVGLFFSLAVSPGRKVVNSTLFLGLVTGKGSRGELSIRSAKVPANHHGQYSHQWRDISTERS